MENFHFITENPWIDITSQGTPIRFKIRHTPEFIPGQLYLQNGKYLVQSQERIQGVAPGQFGVIYDQEAKLCIGSGEIALNS